VRISRLIVIRISDVCWLKHCHKEARRYLGKPPVLRQSEPAATAPDSMETAADTAAHPDPVDEQGGCPAGLWHLALDRLVRVDQVVAVAQGPDVVEQQAVEPRVVLFHSQRDRGRSQAPVVIAEGAIGMGRQLGDGSNAPDPALGVARRQEGGILSIAEGVVLDRTQARLSDQREDGAGDQVPAIVQGNGDDGLYIQDVLSPVLRAIAQVGVVLKGGADEVGDGFWASFSRSSALCVPSAGTAASASRKNPSDRVDAAPRDATGIVLMTGYSASWSKMQTSAS